MPAESSPGPRRPIPQLLIGLVVLAIALFLGAVSVGGAIRDRNSGSDTITVTGSAKRGITSDLVVWNATVSSQQPTAAAAAQELATFVTRMNAFLERAGVKDSEVQLEPVSSQTVTETTEDGRDTGRVVGIKLSRDFEVRSSRLDVVKGVVEESTTLLTQGVPIAPNPPQYLTTKLSGLRPQLLQAAYRDALVRARALASVSGARLGSVQSVKVGVFQVTAPDSTDVADYGVYDTSTEEKDVTAVVSVELQLKS